ncbi:MAG: AAA family ATPase [Fibrobacter sp.]|nr:AAA family ATPase [Fibrobacter sp.]
MKKGKSFWRKLGEGLVITAGTTVVGVGASALISNWRDKKANERKMKMEKLKQENWEARQKLKDGTNCNSSDETGIAVNEEPQFVLPEACKLNTVVCDDKIPTISFFPDTLLERGDLCVLFAPPKVGKSFYAMQMGLNIARGECSGLTPAEQGVVCSPEQVFLLDTELTERDLRTRYKDCSVFPNTLNFIPCHFATVDQVIQSINQIANKTCGNFTVFLDNLSTINPNLTAAQVQDFVSKVCRMQDVLNRQGRIMTFVLVAHSTKRCGTELAGSAQWSRTFRTVIGLDKIDDEHIVVNVLASRSQRCVDSFICKITDSHQARFQYDEDTTAEYHEGEGKCNADSSPKKNAKNKKIVPPPVLEEWLEHYRQGMSYQSIANTYGKPFGLDQKPQIERLLKRRFPAEMKEICQNRAKPKKTN